MCAERRAPRRIVEQGGALIGRIEKVLTDKADAVDAGRASAVTVSSEVRGRISALAADGFTVAGQTVKVQGEELLVMREEDIMGVIA